MASLGASLHYWMHDVWKTAGDKRSDDYFLTRYEYYGPTAVILAYFAFVVWLGPRWMATRPAFRLTKTILTYNSIMVILNAYFFWKTLVNYTWGLDIFDFEYKENAEENVSPMELHKVDVSHQYLLSKFVDLLDTIFFVLRKKQNQVTKLHLYHHISVPMFGWIVFRVIPTNAPVSIFCLLNTFIHVIMYSYYSLAALGPSVQPYLWWKKYVTQLQIYQFVIYSLFSWLFAYRQVGYPAYLQVLAYTQPLIFLVLFSRFYVKSYLRKPKADHDQTVLKKQN